MIQLEELLQSSQEYLDMGTQAQHILTYQADQYLVPNPGPENTETVEYRTNNRGEELTRGKQWEIYEIRKNKSMKNINTNR